ncbi:hypothetical protein SNEBB_005194 [Seison nebaliae]|nr:hypothetical protein SNEBB_005194 [Seison nebaliae]
MINLKPDAVSPISPKSPKLQYKVNRDSLNELKINEAKLANLRPNSEKEKAKGKTTYFVKKDITGLAQNERNKIQIAKFAPIDSKLIPPHLFYQSPPTKELRQAASGGVTKAIKNQLENAVQGIRFDYDGKIVSHSILGDPVSLKNSWSNSQQFPSNSMLDHDSSSSDSEPMPTYSESSLPPSKKNSQDFSKMIGIKTHMPSAIDLRVIDGEEFFSTRDYPALILESKLFEWKEADPSSKAGNETRINFETMIGTKAHKTAVLRNVGNTTIHFKWMAGNRNLTNFHQIQRFYFDGRQEVIRPGETKNKHFVFCSKEAGVYIERWTLDTSPVLENGAPIIVILRGLAMSKTQDTLGQNRIEQKILKYEAESICREVVHGIINSLRIKQRPSTPIERYLTEEDLFRTKNPYLFYNSEVIENINEIYMELMKADQSTIFPNTKSEKINNLLEMTMQPITHNEVKLARISKIYDQEELTEMEIVEEVPKATSEIIDVDVLPRDSQIKEEHIPKWNYDLRCLKDLIRAIVGHDVRKNYLLEKLVQNEIELHERIPKCKMDIGTFAVYQVLCNAIDKVSEFGQLVRIHTGYNPSRTVIPINVIEDIITATQKKDSSPSLFQMKGLDFSNNIVFSTQIIDLIIDDHFPTADLVWESWESELMKKKPPTEHDAPTKKFEKGKAQKSSKNFKSPKSASQRDKSRSSASFKESLGDLPDDSFLKLGELGAQEDNPDKLKRRIFEIEHLRFRERMLVFTQAIVNRAIDNICEILVETQMEKIGNDSTVSEMEQYIERGIRPLKELFALNNYLPFNTVRLTSVGVGSMIGTGVYINSGLAIIEYSGPMTYLCYILAAICMFLTALCYLEYFAFATPYGGSSTIIRAMYGRVMGLTMSTLIQLTMTIITAIFVHAFIFYCDEANHGNYRNQMNEHNQATAHKYLFIFQVPLNWYSIFFLMIIIPYACVHMRVMDYFHSVMVGVDLLIIIFLTFMCYFYSEYRTEFKTSQIPYSINTLLEGSTLAVMAYVGFDIILLSPRVVRVNRRTIMSAIMITLFVGTIIFTFAVGGLLVLSPWMVNDDIVPFAWLYLFNDEIAKLRIFGCLLPLFTFLFGCIQYITWQKHLINIHNTLDVLRFPFQAVGPFEQYFEAAPFTFYAVLLTVFSMFIDYRRLIAFVVIHSLFVGILVSVGTIIIRLNERNPPQACLCEYDERGSSSRRSTYYSSSGGKSSKSGRTKSGSTSTNYTLGEEQYKKGGKNSKKSDAKKSPNKKTDKSKSKSAPKKVNKSGNNMNYNNNLNNNNNNNTSKAVIDEKRNRYLSSITSRNAACHFEETIQAELFDIPPSDTVGNCFVRKSPLETAVITAIVILIFIIALVHHIYNILSSFIGIMVFVFITTSCSIVIVALIYLHIRYECVNEKHSHVLPLGIMPIVPLLAIISNSLLLCQIHIVNVVLYFGTFLLFYTIYKLTDGSTPCKPYEGSIQSQKSKGRKRPLRKRVTAHDQKAEESNRKSKKSDQRRSSSKNPKSNLKKKDKGKNKGKGKGKGKGKDKGKGKGKDKGKKSANDHVGGACGEETGYYLLPTVDQYNSSYQPKSYTVKTMNESEEPIDDYVKFRYAPPNMKYAYETQYGQNDNQTDVSTFKSSPYATHAQEADSYQTSGDLVNPSDVKTYGSSIKTYTDMRKSDIYSSTANDDYTKNTKAYLNHGKLESNGSIGDRERNEMIGRLTTEFLKKHAEIKEGKSNLERAYFMGPGNELEAVEAMGTPKVSTSKAKSKTQNLQLQHAAKEGFDLDRRLESQGRLKKSNVVPERVRQLDDERENVHEAIPINSSVEVFEAAERTKPMPRPIPRASSSIQNAEITHVAKEGLSIDPPFEHEKPLPPGKNIKPRQLREIDGTNEEGNFHGPVPTNSELEMVETVERNKQQMPSEKKASMEVQNVETTHIAKEGLELDQRLEKETPLPRRKLSPRRLREIDSPTNMVNYHAPIPTNSSIEPLDTTGRTKIQRTKTVPRASSRIQDMETAHVAKQEIEMDQKLEHVSPFTSTKMSKRKVREMEESNTNIQEIIPVNVSLELLETVKPKDYSTQPAMRGQLMQETQKPIVVKSSVELFETAQPNEYRIRSSVKGTEARQTQRPAVLKSSLDFFETVRRTRTPTKTSKRATGRNQDFDLIVAAKEEIDMDAQLEHETAFSKSRTIPRRLRQIDGSNPNLHKPATVISSNELIESVKRTKTPTRSVAFANPKDQKYETRHVGKMGHEFEGTPQVAPRLSQTKTQRQFRDRDTTVPFFKHAVAEAVLEEEAVKKRKSLPTHTERIRLPRSPKSSTNYLTTIGSNGIQKKQPLKREILQDVQSYNDYGYEYDVTSIYSDKADSDHGDPNASNKSKFHKANTINKARQIKDENPFSQTKYIGKIDSIDPIHAKKVIVGNNGFIRTNKRSSPTQVKVKPNFAKEAYSYYSYYTLDQIKKGNDRNRPIKMVASHHKGHTHSRRDEKRAKVMGKKHKRKDSPSISPSTKKHGTNRTHHMPKKRRNQQIATGRGRSRH